MHLRVRGKGVCGSGLEYLREIVALSGKARYEIPSEARTEGSCRPLQAWRRSRASEQVAKMTASPQQVAEAEDERKSSCLPIDKIRRESLISHFGTILLIGYYPLPHTQICVINGLAGNSPQNIPVTWVTRKIPNPKHLQTAILPALGVRRGLALTKVVLEQGHTDYWLLTTDNRFSKIVPPSLERRNTTPLPTSILIRAPLSVSRVTGRSDS